MNSGECVSDSSADLYTHNERRWETTTLEKSANKVWCAYPKHRLQFQLWCASEALKHLIARPMPPDAVASSKMTTKNLKKAAADDRRPACVNSFVHHMHS